MSNPEKLRPIRFSGGNFRINLEGVLSCSARGLDKRSDSYVQLYRKGIIEAVHSSMLIHGNEKTIPSFLFEKALLESLKGYQDLLKELGVNMPVVIFLTLLGVKDWKLAVNQERIWRSEVYKIDRDILQLPETIIESYDTEPKDVLRPMFDLIWNACGYERSYNFDEAGNWIGN